MKTVAIIQARMGSTRLPGKIMKVIIDKTVLEHVVERVKKSEQIDEIVLATTTLSRDDAIEKEAIRLGVKCFRGSESNLLSRYYYAAKENNADIIARITSDCPLVDPFVTDKVITIFKENDYDLVSLGAIPVDRTFPRGLDTAVFSFKTLENTFNQATESYHFEHVTPYMHENSKKKYYYKNEEDLSKYRWTLDTPEDFELISKIYSYLYKGKHDFFLSDIIKLLEEHPELSKVNEHIEQKKTNKFY